MPNRKKRDRIERAYQRGLRAGMHGIPQVACPFCEANQRGSWLAGWREGIEHHVHGCLGEWHDSKGRRVG